MSDELCNQRLHMKAPQKGVAIDGYEKLGQHGFHSVLVQRSKAESSGRVRTDHLLWVGSEKFTSAAMASRFNLWVVDKNATMDIKDYTIREIEIMYTEFRAEEAGGRAKAAAQAVTVTRTRTRMWPWPWIRTTRATAVRRTASLRRRSAPSSWCRRRDAAGPRGGEEEEVVVA
jgi:hypothetical protein